MICQLKLSSVNKIHFVKMSKPTIGIFEKEAKWWEMVGVSKIVKLI
jgi:hypothetical protein